MIIRDPPRDKRIYIHIHTQCLSFARHGCQRHVSNVMVIESLVDNRAPIRRIKDLDEEKCVFNTTLFLLHSYR